MKAKLRVSAYIRLEDKDTEITVSNLRDLAKSYLQEGKAVINDVVLTISEED